MEFGLHRTSIRTYLKIALAGVALTTVAVTAFPHYQRYSLSSMVSECMEAATVPQLLIAGFYEREGRWPEVYSEASLFSAEETLKARSEHCMGLSYDSGSQTGSFSVAIYPRGLGLEGSIILYPHYSPTVAPDGTVSWSCSSGKTSENHVEHLPEWCRQRTLRRSLAKVAATADPD